MTLPWTADHAQALLETPHTLLDQEPWGTWIRQQGGLSAVYDILRGFPLGERERQVLEVIIADPGITNQQYADRLYMHRTTFQRVLRRLLDALAAHLITLPAANAPASPASQAPPALAATLPVPMTPLIGRTTLLAAIGAVVLDPARRLITLTGPGGIGKTRLAIQVAWDMRPAFADGVAFVSLTALHDPTQVLPAIAAALDVWSDEAADLERHLAAYLSRRQICLVIDNAEHLLDAMPLLSRLLRQAPHLTILATSRTPLDLYGEYLIGVPPLEVPPIESAVPLAAIQAADAIRLFADRAQAVIQPFALTPATLGPVHTICARLDGIPLALELAAAHLRTLPLEALAAQMDQRLAILTNGPRDVEARQRTLRATISWSYDLLTPDAQALFRQLSVLVNGWTMAALRAVCAAAAGCATDESALQSLLRHQLIYALGNTPDQPRYGMLETIREYACDRLAAHGDEIITRQRHLGYYAEHAEPIEAEMLGDNQLGCIRRTEADYPNLRAAIVWSIEAGAIDRGVQLVGALWRYWRLRGDAHAEGWLRQLTAQAGPATDPRRLARALQGYGVMFMGIDHDKAISLFGQALAFSRHAGDDWRTASILNAQGTCFLGISDLEQARACYAESLRIRQALGDRGEISASLFNFGLFAYSTGQYDEANAYYAQARVLFEELGDTEGMAMLLNNLGAVALAQGRYDTAIAYLTECLPIRAAIAAPGGIVMTNIHLARALVYQGRTRKAREILVDTIRAYPTLEELDGVENAVTTVALLQLAEQRLAGVMEIYGAMAHLRAQHGLAMAAFSQVCHDQIMRGAEAALGPDALHAALAAGRGMTREQIIGGLLKILTRRPSKAARVAGAG